MNIFNIKKQFKRRWRRWKRAAWTITACSIVAFMAWLGMPLSEQLQETMTQAAKPLTQETLLKLKNVSRSPDLLMEELQASHSKKMSVHLIKVYKCGEETQSLGRLKGSEIIDRLKQHPTWQGRIDQQGEVWLESPVNDLSEACKRRGYMGLDAEGNLSLFDGPPQDRNVIHTFFQMDMERIESSLPEKVVNQLKQGIRIQDVEEYNSVISTFSDYAKEQTQKVMQQHR